jgi:hypothetical protein
MADKTGYVTGKMYFPYIFEGKTDKFDRYSCVVVLEGDQVKNARNFGLKVNQREDKYNGLPYVTFKSSYPPILFNAEKEPYDGPQMLVNGFNGTVKFSQRPYDNKYGKGTTTFMQAVLLIDPEEYKPDPEKKGNASWDGSKPSPKKASKSEDEALPF